MPQWRLSAIAVIPFSPRILEESSLLDTVEPRITTLPCLCSYFDLKNP
jgi:hypothetical protein